MAISSRSGLLLRGGYSGGSSRVLGSLKIFLILSCTWLCDGTSGPCCTDEAEVNANYNGCEMYEDTYKASVRELFVSDDAPQCLHVNPVTYLGSGNTYYKSSLFCQSPSSGSEENSSEEGFLEVPGICFNSSSPVISPEVGRCAEETGCLSDRDTPKSSDEPDESSSISSHEVNNSYSFDAGINLNQKELESMGSQTSKMIESEPSQSSMPVPVGISPHILDWGQTYLHVPKLAFLAVTNKQTDSTLHVYRPFSTDEQFYTCNFSESSLQPGEVASVCFIFQPKQLGLSSAHLVLQTSIGGFLVQGKGFAVNQPIDDETLKTLELPLGGWWVRFLSLFSSLNISIYGMEVKPNLPGFVVSLYRKLLHWLRLKKIYIVAFLAVSLLFFRFCSTIPHMQYLISEGDSFQGGVDSMPIVSSVRKSSHVPPNRKVTGFSISCKMEGVHKSNKRNGGRILDVDYADQSTRSAGQSVASQHSNLASVEQGGGDLVEESKRGESMSSPVAKPVVVFDKDKLLRSDLGDLAVKVGKEKRRKKKGRGLGSAKVASPISEVPSSQSGHSTPSSPLSPVTTILLPSRSTSSATMKKSKERRNPIEGVTSQSCKKFLEVSPSGKGKGPSVPKTSFAAAPKQTSLKSVLLPSASFPSASRPAPYAIYPPYSLPPSSIALHARAPGYKLDKQNSFQAKDKAAVVKEEVVNDFTYDIWGDHLCGFDLIGREKEVPIVISPANESGYSFFARGPTLMENYQSRYVSTSDPEGHYCSCSAKWKLLAWMSKLCSLLPNNS